MKWKRLARLVLASIAVAFAIVVGVTVTRRETPKTEPPVPRADPTAVIESEGGTTLRIKGEREDFNLSYERLLTYASGATRMMGVTIVTERSGRTYTIKGGEGQAGENESTMELSAGVRLEATDGMVVTADRASFSKAEGIVRIPGAVQFARDRMKGSGIGLDYDQTHDVVTIGERAAIAVAPDRQGTGAMTLASGSLVFRRTEKIVLLDRGTTITRDRQTVAADQAIAHLTPDEQRLELLELRGNSRISTASTAPGGLEALRGRDIDLRYGADGQLLERAVIAGNADMQLAGERRQAGRRITANALTIDLAPDGSTPTSLVARDNVRVTLPAESGGASRTIAAQALDGTGDGSRGLTGAHFTGNVQFSEQRQDGARSARSQVLDVSMAPGFGTIDEARFVRGVRFVDGDLLATAADGRYAIARGVLELSGSEPGSLTPHVVNDQLSVDASRIAITLEGPMMQAAGSVKSVLTPKKRDGASADTTAKLPSMLKDDQPVNVTSVDLSYDGPADRAVYSGGALLWQGETSVKGSSITINGKTGDLSASGPVTTSTMMLQEDKQGAKQKVSSIGTAKEFVYVDALRRATYTGDAHITGPQGDLTSPRVELFLKPSGDELERAEAYDGVTLQGDGRKTTGIRLTFFGADQRYVVTGTPVTIVDECGRETTGRTLTFFRATDRIVVDGNEQIRTQTRGKSNCS
jgi:lipopolysaccharide export system protein LptA